WQPAYDGVADSIEPAGTVFEQLRGDVAAEKTRTLDQQHPSAIAGCGDGGHDSRCPAACHHDVVARHQRDLACGLLHCIHAAPSAKSAGAGRPAVDNVRDTIPYSGTMPTRVLGPIIREGNE